MKGCENRMNFLSVFMQNDGLLDESALYMPIKVYGQPIGFISAIDEKKIGVLLWNQEWSVDYDEESGEILGVELMGENGEEECWSNE